MKTILYYFTGTGNSLAASKRLSRRLGDCDIIPIASFGETAVTVTPVADRVGIVCPLYFAGLPSIVAGFAGRLDLSRAGYAFALITMGGGGGSAAIRQLDRVLRGVPGGKGLEAGFAVRMPGNYILMYSPPGGTGVGAILEKADRRLDEIAETILAGSREMPSWSPLTGIIQRLWYPRFIAGVNDADRRFSVDDRCTSCGTCAEVCPVGNIKLDNGRPVWLHHCEQCMACIHTCPPGAIQAGEKTEKRTRYRHPGVGVDELKAQHRKE